MAHVRIVVHTPAGTWQTQSLRAALRSATSALKPYRGEGAYRAGGQGPGPFRIKTAAGSSLAVCTAGAKTSNRKRRGRPANQRVGYVNCKLTPMGKRVIARERG